MNIKASTGGRRAQRAGSSWEEIFEFIAKKQGIGISRVPNGCKRVGPKLIPVKSPFDWILSYQGKSAVIDTKTVQNDKMPAGDMTPHQVAELLKHYVHGIIAGYVIWLREPGTVFFVTACQLAEHLKSREAIRYDSLRHNLLGYNGQIDLTAIFVDLPR